MFPGFAAKRPQSTGRKGPAPPSSRLGGLASLSSRFSPKRSLGGGRLGTSTTSSSKAAAKSPRQANTTTQVILDKVPAFQDMCTGNSSLYYIPFSIHTARIEAEWGKNLMRSAHVEVEVSIAMFTWAGKRFDFVSNTRRTSKDKSITYVGEDTLSAFTASTPATTNPASLSGTTAGLPTASSPASGSPPSILKTGSVSVAGKSVSMGNINSDDATDDDQEATLPFGLAAPPLPSPRGNPPSVTSEHRVNPTTLTSRQEYPSRETFQVKLQHVTSAVAYIAVVVYVKTPSKTLSDLKGPRSSVGDSCYYPENPLLLRYDHTNGENNVPAVCSLLLASEPLPKSPVADKVETAEIDVKRIPSRRVARNATEPPVPRLWSVRSPGFPLKGRNFRQISDELEHFIDLQLSETASGSTKRPTDVGGDPTRVAAHRLSERAEEIERGGSPTISPIRRASVARPPAGRPNARKQSISVSARGTGSATTRPAGRVSPDTESGSSDDSDGGETGGDLFYVTGAQRSLQPPLGVDPTQRIRVVRKDTKSYSIGQGVRNHESESDFEDISDEELNPSSGAGFLSRPTSARQVASSPSMVTKAPHPPPSHPLPPNGVDDETLLESVFPHYINPHITRYESSVYNRGSHRQSLLEHYLRRKETYDTMLATISRTPKDTVTVKQVSNTVETEEDIEREQQLDPDALKPKLPAVMADMIVSSNQGTVNYLKALATQQRQAGQKRGVRRPKTGGRSSSRLASFASPKRPLSSSSSKVVRKPPSTSFSPRNSPAASSSWGGKTSSPSSANQWTTKPQ